MTSVRVGRVKTERKRELKAPKLEPFSVCACVCVRLWDVAERGLANRQICSICFLEKEKEAAPLHPTHSTTNLHFKRQNSQESNHPLRCMVVLQLSLVFCSLLISVSGKDQSDECSWQVLGFLESWLVFDRCLLKRLREPRQHTDYCDCCETLLGLIKFIIPACGFHCIQNIQRGSFHNEKDFLAAICLLILLSRLKLINVIRVAYSSYKPLSVNHFILLVNHITVTGLSKKTLDSHLLWDLPGR